MSSSTQPYHSPISAIATVVAVAGHETFATVTTVPTIAIDTWRFEICAVDPGLVANDGDYCHCYCYLYCYCCDGYRVVAIAVANTTTTIISNTIMLWGTGRIRGSLMQGTIATA